MSRTPISEVMTDEVRVLEQSSSATQPSSFEIYEVLDIQTSEDMETLLSSKRINFVDCYADWCGPCKRIYPSYKKMSEDYSANQRIRFFKLNIDTKVDEIQEFVNSNQITFIPFFLMVENGKTTRTFSNFGELQDCIKKTF